MLRALLAPSAISLYRLEPRLAPTAAPVGLWTADPRRGSLTSKDAGLQEAATRAESARAPGEFPRLLGEPAPAMLAGQDDRLNPFRVGRAADLLGREGVCGPKPSTKAVASEVWAAHHPVLSDVPPPTASAPAELRLSRPVGLSRELSAADDAHLSDWHTTNLPLFTGTRNAEIARRRIAHWDAQAQPDLEPAA